jgi:hypothetical protein
MRAMKELPYGADRAIVNVASMASLQHNLDAYAYRTSKAGCAHFTQSVEKDAIGLDLVNLVSTVMWFQLILCCWSLCADTSLGATNTPSPSAEHFVPARVQLLPLAGSTWPTSAHCSPFNKVSVQQS